MAPVGHDPLGWIIVIAGSLVTVWTIVYAIRAMISPGEAQPDHPKQLILKEDR